MRSPPSMIDGTVGWERFMVAVDGAKGLNGRHGEDPIELLGASYAHLRRCLVAERHWDQARWAIEAYAWRFEDLERALGTGGTA